MVLLLPISHPSHVRGQLLSGESPPSELSNAVRESKRPKLVFSLSLALSVSQFKVLLPFMPVQVQKVRLEWVFLRTV